jgi:hypothetical protein
MLRRHLAALVVCSLALNPAVAHAATPLGADTPQALVARMNKAAQTKDMAEIAACLDPESRTQLAAMMMLAGVMMVGFMGMGSEMGAGMTEAMGDQTAEAKQKAAASKKEADAKIAKAKAGMTAVFKKHGLPDMMDEKAPEPTGDPKELFAKIDQPAFIKDMIGFLETIGEGKEKGDSPTDKMPDMKSVTDYKITGNTATAKAGSETLDFVKVDGKWFLKMPEKKAETEPAKS